MPKRHTLSKDLTGQQFGKLTILEPVKFVTRWKCLCECGRLSYATTANLIRGTHRSCGCLVQERNSELNTTHGLSYSPIYGLWANMLQRCHNPNIHKYPRYGGRGITVCARWHTFENFFEDIGQYRPSKAYSLDRKDNDKGYWCGTCEECSTCGQESNCRWATQSEQARNTSATVNLTFKDQTKTLYEWADLTGLPFTTLELRFRRGWPTEDILTIPKFASGHRRKRVRL